MSTSTTNQITTGYAAEGAGARGMGCDAHELKRILHVLADQVADADRRHSQALAGMQERLAHLDTTARDLKTRMPEEMSPVLDRIQGGMAALSGQIASGGVAPPAQQAPASQPEVESAPALRSALAAEALDAYARRSKASRNVDNFDVVEWDKSASEPGSKPSSTPTQADPGWDETIAQALTSHFEQAPSAAAEVPVAEAPRAATELPARTTPPAVVLSAAAVAPAPKAAPAPAAAVGDAGNDFAAIHAHAMTQEREWLESRFTSIASRIEASLLEISANGALSSIDHRFSELEGKLSVALASTSKTPDTRALEGIESQVEELSAQLLSVQNHFSRLDNIELELRSLADRFKSERMTRLLENGGDQRQPDTDALAGAVATRVVQEMPKLDQRLATLSESLSAEKLAGLFSNAAPRGNDAGEIARRVAEEIAHTMPQRTDAATGPAIDDLRAMIEQFVVEQRQGGEQTVSMLDTMQQAMISLLDRMDAIEQTALAHLDAQPHDEQSAVAQQPSDTNATQYEDYSRAPSSHAGTVSDRHYADQQPQYDTQERAPAISPVAARVPEYENEHDRAREIDPAKIAQRPAIVHSVDAAEQSLPNRREDFISAARRAARMANENPPEAPVAEEAAPARAGLAQKLRGQPDAQKSRLPLSRVSMALLCLVAVGASFAVVKSTILAPNRAAAPVAPAAAPAPAPKAGQQSRGPADKSLQQLEDADVIIEDDRKGAAPGPRRSALDGGTDFSSAFDGATGKAIPASQIQGPTAFSPAMTEFARQNIPASNAALTKDQPAGALGKSVDTLPLTIGPNSLRAAAIKGDASAEFEIGARFAEGRGVTQNLEQAITWYQKSAAQGFAPAQYRLGSMYERGLGVKADIARARVWYQRAAEQGIVKAMHNLAVLTAGRDATAADYEAAAKWFKAAADHGLTDSQFNLAIMHDSGLGMPKDARQAYKWFSLAARAGDDEAARRREALRSKLQPQETAETEAEIAQWRARSADQGVNDPRMAGEAWKSRAR